MMNKIKSGHLREKLSHIQMDLNLDFPKLKLCL